MPAEVTREPLGIACTFSDGTSARFALGGLPCLELAEDLLTGLAELVHPHGTVDAAGSVGHYVASVRHMARQLDAAGFSGGASGLRRAQAARYWMAAPGPREACTRRMLQGFQAAGGTLDAGVAELAAGRAFNPQRNRRQLPPYSEAEWARLAGACELVAGESFAAHKQALAAAGRGRHPREHGWSGDNLRWLLARTGPVGIVAFGEHLGCSENVVRQRGGVLDASRDLFPGLDTVIGYRLLFGIYSGIVPDGRRRVVLELKARRMRCPVLGCGVQTFREQVTGVLERYQRRTARLAGQVEATVRALAGRAGSRLLAVLGIDLSRHTALRTLLRLALPDLQVPRVLGIDDFALRKGLVYATILIDAETGRRVDVLEGRTADVVEEWLRAHPGVEVVTRDGSGAYGEAVRSALPDAVQCGDRWHLWHLLAEAAGKEVAAHSACWAEGAPLPEGRRAETTRERWQQVHDLRSQGVGLLDCSRRLGLALNTVKRYDRAGEPGKLRRAAQYRPTLVDPYRDYLRQRRAGEPGVPVQQLLREIREKGYPGSSNLLVRYLNQGRADAERPHIAPRKATQILLTRPDNLTDGQRETAGRLASACLEMKALATPIGSFAAMLAPTPENEKKLQQWISDARAADLPHLHSFTRGLDIDIKAATAAVTLPHHNGRTEGVNNKTKMIKRQMFGRAGFELLRHRILLG